MKTICLFLNLLFSVYLYGQINLTATIGTPSGSFTTLKSAFDKINDGTHQGNIVITIGTSDNQVITETAEASLNKSGSGLANYTLVQILPGALNIKVTGNLASSIVKLTAASNVTIDGRIGGSGSTIDLTFENTMVGTSSNALYLIGVSNSQFNYVKFKSSNSSTSAGTIYMLHDAAAGGIGNTNILFDYCEFDKAGSTNPKMALMSRAVTGKLSQNNIVSNCIFKNFTRFGIFLGSTSGNGYNSNWEISGNSFFQESSISLNSTDFSNYAISIGYVNTSATHYQESGSFSIHDNVIGGNGSGGNWSNSSTATTATMVSVGGIFLSASNTAYSSIQNNTISNFSVQSYTNDQTYYKFFGFNGIYVYNSKVNIGDISGNTVESINLTHSYTSFGSVIAGIFVQNNTNLTCTIKNNTVKNIVTTGPSAASRFQSIYGIYMYDNSSVGTDFINKNKISDIDASNASYIYGIYGQAKITQNHVSYFKGLNGFEIFGIWTATGPPSTQRNEYRIENNEIILGTDRSFISTAGNQKITGLYVNHTAYVYYNSILILGTHTTASTSNTTQCIRLNSNTAGYVFKNNLMFNDRSGGSAKHFCLSTAFTTTSYITSSNNAYVKGLAATQLVGLWGTNDKSDLTALSAVTSETNSIASTNDIKTVAYLFPNLSSIHNLLPINDGWLCAGTVVEELNDKIDVVRNPIDPTTIGAYELNCAVQLPVDMILHGEIVGNQNKLNWITYSERNNDYFVLQRSEDGINWEYVSLIDGSGNSTYTIEYEFTDVDIFDKSFYYRIKQLDYDGVYSYSNVIFLERNSNEFKFSVYPNPASKSLNFESNKFFSNYGIYDINGKLILEKHYENPIKSDQIDLTSLQNGVYYMVLSNLEGTISKKIIVQN